MAHWQLGHKDEARQWYDKAVEWMKNNPADDELTRFRAEADELLGTVNRPEEAKEDLKNLPVDENNKWSSFGSLSFREHSQSWVFKVRFEVFS